MMQSLNPIIVVSGPRVFPDRYFPVVLRGMTTLFVDRSPTLRQGGAMGVDAMAKRAAAVLGWRVEPDWRPNYNFPPTGWMTGKEAWKKVAPLRRTEDMLDGTDWPTSEVVKAPADMLVVFRTGPELARGGTGHAVREARRRRIPIVVFEWPEVEE